VRGLAVSVVAALFCAACMGGDDGDGAPASGPPGIAFVAKPDGYVYTVRADGRGLRRLSGEKDWGAEKIAWSPDGSRIAVASAKVPSSERYSSSLVVLDADGASPRRLALLRPDQVDVRWKGNETIQVLEHRPSRTTIVRLGSEIWVMNANGSAKRRLGEAPLTHTGPDWSPDGRSLAYQADADDDCLDELYVIAASGGHPRKLLETDYIHDIAWQPGRRKARVVGTPPPSPGRRKPVRTFSYELTQGSVRLADVRLLRRFPSDEERPRLADLSPDGSLLALFDRGELSLLDLKTNRMEAVARPRSPAYEPSALFSPDGRRLLYRDGNRLVAHDLESGREALVGRTRSDAFTWLRDGRVVFFDRGRIKMTRPGEEPHALTGIPRVDRFAIAPDGRRLVYDRRCETFLLDRRTGRRRRLSGHLFVSHLA
jgi:WD40-like Beta Propeller Repeat